MITGKDLDKLRAIDNGDPISERIGAAIAKELKMRRDPRQRERWNLVNGNKTNIGLARTVLRIILETK